MDQLRARQVGPLLQSGTVALSSLSFMVLDCLKRLLPTKARGVVFGQATMVTFYPEVTSGCSLGSPRDRMSVKFGKIGNPAELLSLLQGIRELPEMT